jgi:ligand-binding SRPBCC domain-containing protein
MPLISLSIDINAPIERVFDLARSIYVHKISTKHTNETAIAGKTSGLIELNDTVTWRAKHLGFYQTLTSKITQYNKPYFFEDCMLEGIFAGFQHQHIFEKIDDNKTMMKDEFNYTSPFGMIGKIADKLFLENYMRNLLIKRNDVIKEIAEGEDWREILRD